MKMCPKCGLSMSDDSRFCSACGAETVSAATAVTQTVTPSVPVIATDVRTSDKALASMILGLCVFVAGFLAGLPAVILGHMAKTEIRNSNGKLRGDGMALTGLILGYLSLALLPIIMILIIAAIAIPNLLRSRSTVTVLQRACAHLALRLMGSRVRMEPIRSTPRSRPAETTVIAFPTKHRVARPERRSIRSVSTLIPSLRAQLACGIFTSTRRA